MKNLFREISKAVITGFVDDDIESNTVFQPKLIVNDINREEKTLSYLVNRLETCEDFWFSAAFLTNSGLASLHNALKIFSKRNQGNGKIIVSDYLNFTQPDALKRISDIENIDTRLYAGENYHGKGYLFRFDDRYDFLICIAKIIPQNYCFSICWNP